MSELDKELKELLEIKEIYNIIHKAPCMQAHEGEAWAVSEHLYKEGYRKPKEKSSIELTPSLTFELEGTISKFQDRLARLLNYASAMGDYGDPHGELAVISPQSGKVLARESGSLKPKEKPPNKDTERIYPCDMCGKLRSKDEGGTTFTVCDECWNKLHPKLPKEKPPFSAGCGGDS